MRSLMKSSPAAPPAGAGARDLGLSGFFAMSRSPADTSFSANTDKLKIWIKRHHDLPVVVAVAQAGVLYQVQILLIVF